MTKYFIDEREFLVFPHYDSVEKQKKILSPKKSFVKSTLVFSLVKTLLSQNFCLGRASVKFRNFHTVHDRVPKLADF